jgi:NTP pyrophosphatase (non-canonical NTP hydrolase)
MTSDIRQLQEALRAFAKAREWGRYHTPKNLAMALSVEVAELVELFQWLSPEESARLMHQTGGRTAIEDEMADILLYLLRLADILEVDISDAARNKLLKNEKKYPASAPSSPPK